MGRQIALCLLDSDLELLEGELRKGEDFRIIQDLSDRPEATEAVGGLRQQRQMAFLVLTKDLPHVRLRPIPGKTSYYVDQLTSPVIEFSACWWNGSEMRPGRLFFDPKPYFEGTTQVEKPEGFLKWSNWIMATSRKVLTFDRETGALWGAEARRLRDASGVKLLSL
ncbi:hypothetical protein [Corallococcus sicarius]|uniref:Uncharacterized protein n=1 Tax=Corallococcus sicarius TaxID=2316726 RepID=A0A3A8NQ60_9BACT|nr:hypothetical protein [Corallococcus sicarius]RKH46203.1 hypothetical protein D7X12_05895 [Corallococcus sicarius]